VNAINLTGNKFDQTLLGNAGNNVLDGGIGADTMNGSLGDDTYRVDNAGDVVIETAGNGANDRVNTSVSYALGATSEIERFQTTSVNGTDAIDLTGSSAAQTIFGNAGDNRIDGKDGSDTLRGFGGEDSFVFSRALGITNIDTIEDFNVAADTIELDSDIFTGLAAGAIAANQFTANAAGAALNANHRIIYETDSGNLIFDADGSGAGAGQVFATVSLALALTSDDFVVFVD
jgi:Ca2+-binding RTX toxin-like protein